MPERGACVIYMNETAESIECLYRHKIADEKRKRKITERYLENERSENVQLREEVARLTEICVAEKRRKRAVARVCVSVVAAVAAFAAVKRHHR